MFSDVLWESLHGSRDGHIVLRMTAMPNGFRWIPMDSNGSPGAGHHPVLPRIHRSAAKKPGHWRPCQAFRKTSPIIRCVRPSAPGAPYLERQSLQYRHIVLSAPLQKTMRTSVNIIETNYIYTYLNMCVIVCVCVSILSFHVMFNKCSIHVIHVPNVRLGSMASHFAGHIV